MNIYTFFDFCFVLFYLVDAAGGIGLCSSFFLSYLVFFFCFYFVVFGAWGRLVSAGFF